MLKLEELSNAELELYMKIRDQNCRICLGVDSGCKNPACAQLAEYQLKEIICHKTRGKNFTKKNDFC